MMRIAGRQYPVWLILAYVAALLAICAWPIFAFSSLFLFDAPGAAQQTGPYVFAGILVLYPIIPILGVPGSFFAYRGEHKRLAYALAGIALLPTALILVLLIAMLVQNVWFMLYPPKLQITTP